MKKINIISYAVIMIVAYLGCVQVIHCCNVPVFRYALERWQRSLYTLLVLSKGELDENSISCFHLFRLLLL